jgi:branched-chain amino acid aminotransferase
MRVSRQLARNAVLRASSSPITVSLQSSAANRLWQRSYSIKPVTKATPQLPGLDSSKLTITKTTTPKELIPPEQLVFGKTFTGEELSKTG